MGFERVLFSFEGRVDRLTWWVAQLVLGVVFAVTFFVFNMTLGPMAAFLSVVPLYWSLTALNVKRLHDRGHSGWWLLVLVLAGVIGTFSSLVLPLLAGDRNTTQVAIGLIGALIVLGIWSFWLTLQMMLLRGSPGPNKYGQPPLLLVELFGSEPAHAAMAASPSSIARADIAVGPVRHGGGLPRRAQTVEPIVRQHPGRGTATPQAFGKRR